MKISELLMYQEYHSGSAIELQAFDFNCKKDKTPHNLDRYGVLSFPCKVLVALVGAKLALLDRFFGNYRDLIP